MKAGDTLLLTLEIRQLKRKAPEIEERERREQQAGSARQPTHSRAVVVQLTASDPAVARAEAGSSRSSWSAPPRRPADCRSLRERVLRRNPYKLDKWGILNVPELGPIPLAGLTAEEATQRLTAELSLEDFIVGVTRLPLKPMGTEALKPFGYDLFARRAVDVRSRHRRAGARRVRHRPRRYLAGPADRQYQGPLFAGGRPRRPRQLSRARSDPGRRPALRGGARNTVERVVGSSMIGTQVSVSMGELRSIRVFVLGDAEVPGSYTVSGLSTITNALFVSGGVKKIGSLRNIQLKRAGRTVDDAGSVRPAAATAIPARDARLLPGDVIFVPPVGADGGAGGRGAAPGDL